MDEITIDSPEVGQSPNPEPTFEEPTFGEDNKLKELEAQKRHWREKALKESEARKSLEERLQKLAPKESQAFATKEELSDIRLDSKGFDATTIGFIKTYAKGAGKDPMEVLNDESVKEYIEQRQQKARLAEAIPSSSSRTTSVKLDKPWTEMSDADRRAHFEKVRKTRLG